VRMGDGRRVMAARRPGSGNGAAVALPALQVQRKRKDCKREEKLSWYSNSVRSFVYLQLTDMFVAACDLAATRGAACCGL
jgi:hypothetical protein